MKRLLLSITTPLFVLAGLFPATGQTLTDTIVTVPQIPASQVIILPDKTWNPQTPTILVNDSIRIDIYRNGSRVQRWQWTDRYSPIDTSNVLRFHAHVWVNSESK